MPYFELVRTMQYTETAYVKANSKEEADQMFGIFVENYDLTNYDNNTYEITEQEYEKNNMSEEESPENVKIWEKMTLSAQESSPLKGMQFSVECALSEEDMQKMMEDLRVSIYNSEVGE